MSETVDVVIPPTVLEYIHKTQQLSVLRSRIRQEDKSVKRLQQPVLAWLRSQPGETVPINTENDNQESMYGLDGRLSLRTMYRKRALTRSDMVSVAQGVCGDLMSPEDVPELFDRIYRQQTVVEVERVHRTFNKKRKLAI
jgi:hypothetical protein